MDTEWLSKQFKAHPLGFIGALVVTGFIFIAIYAPFLASSKPIAVVYDGKLYFPLFRYLFYSGFFTKPLDLFFNLLIFTFPLSLIFWRRKKWLLCIALFQCLAFAFLLWKGVTDPANDLKLIRERQLKQKRIESIVPAVPEWSFKDELASMSPYAKLNAVVHYRLIKAQQKKLEELLAGTDYPHLDAMPTLWNMEETQIKEKNERIEEYLKTHEEAYLRSYTALEQFQAGCDSLGNEVCQKLLNESQVTKKLIQSEQSEVITYEENTQNLKLIEEKGRWLEAEQGKLTWVLMPLLRPFHWEDDAGGGQSMNPYLPWWDLTRVNRKDLMAALIFGTRVSIVVGLLAVALALAIGVPVGAYAGYYGGVFDIIVSRILEVWESMPTFFMLLLIIAMMQSKSIFIVIAVIGIFGWTGFSRYIRGEFFKQRNLAYVEACRSIGLPNSVIMFKQILPNAIPPLLTLLPFAIMGAITSEAGLSFLGLGEEGSCSWGVLMDEGRNAFPGEAYLLWPPSILLTILLVAIALLGDAMRDALDPKLKR